MSDEQKKQTEQELWDVIGGQTPAEPKPAKAPKSEGKFAKPGPMKEPVAEKPAKAGRKMDGFFFGCMAAVAAVSVAATLVIGGMLGNDSPAPADPVVPGTVESTEAARLSELEQENARLQAKVEEQQVVIKDLQKDLIDLMGAEEYLATAPTYNSGEETGEEDPQIKALETFAAIQAAYADYDRAQLEELIPQMDQLLGYLPPDALNNYYLILEYVEQPSNDQ